MIDAPLKRCSKGDDCVHPDGPELPATTEYFYRHHNSLDTLCRKCHNARSSAYRAAHQVEIAEMKRDWKERNLEAHLQQKRDHYAANRERILKEQRAHYYDNRDSILEKERVRRTSNPEFFREKGRTAYKKHKPHIRDYQRKWRVENREKDSAIKRRYKARKRNAPGSHTGDDIILQYQSQKGLCWWCEKPVDNDYHVDHRIPLNRGGSNNPDSLVISCPACNCARKDRLPHEWEG